MAVASVGETETGKEAGGAEQHNITEEVRKGVRAGHRQGGGVWECSSGVVREINIAGSEFSDCRRTHTLFAYPLGKPLEAKLLKEPIFMEGNNDEKIGAPGLSERSIASSNPWTYTWYEVCHAKWPHSPRRLEPPVANRE